MEPNTTKSLLENTRYYSNFLMIAVYLALGALFLFSDVGIQFFPSNRAEAGGVLIAYAAYRFYSTYKKIKKNT